MSRPAIDDRSYLNLPKPERAPRYFSFAFEIGAWWLAALLAVLLAMPWLAAALRADAQDRWRIERLSAVMQTLALDLAPQMDLSAGGFRNRRAAERFLDSVLTSDASIRSIELYDAERKQHLTTDRGSLGAAMPAAWQRAASNAPQGVWVAAQAGERDYALGMSLVDEQGGFAGYLVIAASKPSNYGGGAYNQVAINLAIGLALFASAVALLYLAMPYARTVANEEADIELLGDELPDETIETAPQQARDVVARVRRRLKAALALLGAEAGTG